MPKEIESLFVTGLSLQTEKLLDPAAKRQQDLRETLNELVPEDKHDKAA
jgi:hypothetical protein